MENENQQKFKKMFKKIPCLVLYVSLNLHVHTYYMYILVPLIQGSINKKS